jgi:hypothetical protein
MDRRRRVRNWQLALNCPKDITAASSVEKINRKASHKMEGKVPNVPRITYVPIANDASIIMRNDVIKLQLKRRGIYDYPEPDLCFRKERRGGTTNYAAAPRVRDPSMASHWARREMIGPLLSLDCRFHYAGLCGSRRYVGSLCGRL